MGSTGTYKSPNISIIDFFKDELYSLGEKNYEFIAASAVGFDVVYIAEKYVPTGEIKATVVKYSYNRKSKHYGENIVYKTISEVQGPYYFGCPEKILKLLTPTDNVEANKWRNACRNLKKVLAEERKKVENLQPGQALGDKYIFVRKNKSPKYPLIVSKAGMLYRITARQALEAMGEIVQVTL